MSRMFQCKQAYPQGFIYEHSLFSFLLLCWLLVSVTNKQGNLFIKETMSLATFLEHIVYVGLAKHSGFGPGFLGLHDWVGTQEEEN